MFDFLFPKRKLKRELETLRKSIELKKSEVELCEKESRRAWGEKWSYLQMQRRKQAGAAGESVPPALDGQVEALEIRRQQALAELRRREQELAELLAGEQKLAAELGEIPKPTPSEASGEK